MRLTRVRITNFKCVLDSEWFSVDELTCLVGKNESGKTAVLEALEKLNSVDPERSDFEDTDYPRINYSEYEESSDVDIAVHTEWELDSEEITHINGLVGSEILTSTTVKVTKDYGNEVKWTISLNHKAAATALLEHGGLNATDRKPLGDVESVQRLIEELKRIENPSPRQKALLDDLNQRFPAGTLATTVNNYIKPRLPKFVYYSQYDRLPGRVSLEQLVAARQNGTLHQIQGAKVFVALLSMVGTTPENIGGITTSEELISKLEAVENRLSKRIFKYWSQNRHLEVRFRFDQASPSDPAPYNIGKVFQTRIYNSRHKATINLEERSTGFIWFFSFLVWFSEVTREHGDNLIVLLDEPGLSLHGRAQYDLLRFMNEELLPKYQVVYSTHSPFMIDPASLLSCRTVEDVVTKDDEVLGTKIGDDVLSTDRDTLFPLQAALGYDITQTMFIGKDCLLVEGPSDLLYLQWASAELVSRKRTGLDRRWTITPCGGITKVFSFMSLFGGSKLHVAVLTDFTSGDKKKVRELRDSDLLKDGHVFTADMYAEGSVSEADVEDILGRDFYIDLVNAAYGLKPKQKMPSSKPAGASERVVVETEEYFRTLTGNIPEYDHYHPSRHLIENSATLQLRGVDEALDRFERLFTELNALL